MRKKFSVVWVTLFLYVAGYFIICINTGKQELLWLELSFLSLMISAVLLIKNGFPKRKCIVVSLFLAMLYLVSNVFRFNAFTVIQGIIVFLSCSASCSIFEKCDKNSLCMIRNEKKRDVVISVAIGILCGILWGGINYLLIRGSNPVVETNVFKAMIVSMNPAILEEVAYRCVFFAEKERCCLCDDSTWNC